MQDVLGFCVFRKVASCFKDVEDNFGMEIEPLSCYHDPENIIKKKSLPQRYNTWIKKPPDHKLKIKSK